MRHKYCGEEGRRGEQTLSSPFDTLKLDDTDPSVPQNHVRVRLDLCCTLMHVHASTFAPRERC